MLIRSFLSIYWVDSIIQRGELKLDIKKTGSFE